MDAPAALAFVREHGVVLVSAKGPAPTLADAIAGAPIKGSWWGHPQGKRIFAVLELVSADPDVLVCRLAGGKLTLVHSRPWPALAAAAPALAPARLCRVTQQHSASGRHVNTGTPFPDWLPAHAAEQAGTMTPADALDALGPARVTNGDKRNRRD